jgi:alpha-L-fucosidase
MGDWMKLNSRSVYNCTEAPAGITKPDNTLLTYNPLIKRLYIHLLSYPMGTMTLINMADKVKYIQFLHDASEIRYSKGRGESANDLSLDLPVQKPPVEIPVLEVFLK